jgi:hypothetical protein
MSDPVNATARPRTDDPRDLVESHLGLFVAGLTSLVIVLRILAISSFQPWTALAVLTSAGAPGILLGTVLLAVPYVSPTVAMVAFWMYREHPQRTDRDVWLFLALIAAVVSLVSTPAILLAFVIFMIAMVPVVNRWFRKSGRVAPADASPYRRFGPIVFSFLPFVWAYPAPWIAPEKIVDETHGVLVGYVLSTDSRWTHVLQTQPRTVVILETSEVTGRTYCKDPISIWGATVGQLPSLDRLPPGMPPC